MYNDNIPDFDSNEVHEICDQLPDFFDIADRLCDLYISYRQRFVMMINGSIFIPKGKDGHPLPLTNRKVCQHLHKKLAIGVFAGEHSSKFICFDVDDGSRETVRQIIVQAVRFGIPEEMIYVSSSGGKGYHVEIFFDNLVYTKKLAILYDWVTINGRLDTSKVEFRPTHKQSIKLPLSKHAKTGNVCWFVNPKTFEPYETENFILTIKKMSSEKFNALVDNCGLRMAISDDLDEMIEQAAQRGFQIIPTRELTKDEQDYIDRISAYSDIVEPGQRHKLTMSIAIHNRTEGMPKEESLSRLLDWWRNQDKSCTNTSDDEAVKDICDLVEWTYSDKFIPPVRTKTLKITEDLLRLVLSQKNKTDRKLLFLIGCYRSVYGRMNMSYDRIGEHIGVAGFSAIRRIELLSEAGWITVKKGRTAYKDGQFIGKPNTYYIPQSAFEKCKDVEITNASTLPFVYEAKEVNVPSDSTGRPKTVVPELEPEGFLDFYYDTLRRTLSKSCLRKYLTREEYNALRCSHIA